jgi:protein TonB
MTKVAGDFHGCQSDKSLVPNDPAMFTRCTVILNKGTDDNPSSITEVFLFQRGVLQAVKLTASDQNTYEALRQEVTAQYGATPRPVLAFVPKRQRIVIIEQPLRVGDHATPPKLLEKVEPDYPVGIRKQGVEGVVILEAIITTDGNVENPTILKHLDPTLDDSALHAIKRWKYEPAKYDGDPVAVYLAVTTTFSLHGQAPHP